MARLHGLLLSPLFAALSLLMLAPIPADEPAADTVTKPIAGWRHAGHVWLLTDSEGADLPADAILHDVPVVVRLDDEFFDFAAAQPHGEDLRLTSDAGEVLPHEIESWDRDAGTAGGHGDDLAAVAGHSGSIQIQCDLAGV
jgi:hypothetical protein